MIRQERAQRTRALLIQAAGAEFVRYGYAGTSLARITDSAQATIGALTFHFSTKAELADSVCRLGSDLTHNSVDHAVRASTTPLDRVTVVLHVLSGLLHEKTAVRAAARLSRERPEARFPWTDAWLSRVQKLVLEAHKDGSLGGDTPPEAVTQLVRCLVTGVEATMPQYRGPAGEAPDPGDHVGLTTMWRLIVPALTRESPRPGT